MLMGERQNAAGGPQCAGIRPGLRLRPSAGGRPLYLGAIRGDHDIFWKVSGRVTLTSTTGLLCGTNVAANIIVALSG